MSTIQEFEPLWGAWRTIKLLGQGSYGKVWLAQKDGGTQTYQAAIKHISIPANPSESEELYAQGYVTNHSMVTDYYRDVLETLLVEIQVNDHLKGNTNIVSYEDHHYVPKADGKGYDLFIKMELLTSLFNHWKTQDVTLRDCLQLGIDLSAALSVLEQEHIIHRDIKPGNIFVNKRGDYKLGDFGVARVLERTTGGLSVKGTFGYMAPEVYLGKDYDFSVDIYSLGLVMYRLLNCNRDPFVPLPPHTLTYAESQSGKQRRFQGETLPPPAMADNSLAAIIDLACAYSPQKRWANAKAFRTALINYRNGLSEKQLSQVLLQATEKSVKDFAVTSSPTDKEPAVNSLGINEPLERSVPQDNYSAQEPTMFLAEPTLFIEEDVASPRGETPSVAEPAEPQPLFTDATVCMEEEIISSETEIPFAPAPPVATEPAVFFPAPMAFAGKDDVAPEPAMPASEPAMPAPSDDAPTPMDGNEPFIESPPIAAQTDKPRKKTLRWIGLAVILTVFAVVAYLSLPQIPKSPVKTESIAMEELVEEAENDHQDEDVEPQEEVVEAMVQRGEQEEFATLTADGTSELEPAVEEVEASEAEDGEKDLMAEEHASAEEIPDEEPEEEMVTVPEEETVTEPEEETVTEPAVEPVVAAPTTTSQPAATVVSEPVEEVPAEIAVTGIQLSSASLLLEIGGTGFLQATVSPSNATAQAVSWSSSNSGVAQVQGGTVIAYGSGTASITASCGGFNATCTVSVS